jgi:hypothetical protein
MYKILIPEGFFPTDWDEPSKEKLVDDEEIYAIMYGLLPCEQFLNLCSWIDHINECINYGIEDDYIEAFEVGSYKLVLRKIDD